VAKKDLRANECAIGCTRRLSRIGKRQGLSLNGVLGVLERD
jgi:hypothetical protein